MATTINQKWQWMFLLGMIALADTIYISISHFVPGPAPDFAYTMGIPSAPVGILFYLAVLFFIGFFLKTGKDWGGKVLFGLLLFEFVAGLNAFYSQTFVLRFFCPYAYLYVGVSISMFILGLMLRREMLTR